MARFEGITPEQVYFDAELGAFYGQAAEFSCDEMFPQNMNKRQLAHDINDGQRGSGDPESYKLEINMLEEYVGGLN